VHRASSGPESLTCSGEGLKRYADKSSKGVVVGKKKGKYAAELAKIKELSVLEGILKKGDVENALLTNSAKESEPVSENVIDAILSSVDKGKIGEKDMALIEKLTTKSTGKHHRSGKKASKAKKKSQHKPVQKRPKAKKHGR
jgi:hypothetical protein